MSSEATTTTTQTIIALAKQAKHPLAGVARRYKVIGGMAIVLSGLTPLYFRIALANQSGAATVCSLALFVCGAFIFWNGWALETIAGGAPYLNTAVRCLSRGQLEEAEQLHAALPPRIARRATAIRTLNVQRAMIALSRGDAASAKRFANDAADPSMGLFTQGWESTQRIEAIGLRAIAHAALGDAESADRDAREVEASAHARPSALARIGLARAINLARNEDRSALRTHLVARGSLILEYAMPRERSLLRAFRALARSTSKSAYREQGRREDEEEEGETKKLRSWIAQVAPDAAAFAPDERIATSEGGEGDGVVALRMDAQALHAIAASRQSAVKGAPRRRTREFTIALWLGLVVLFVSIWELLTPTTTTTTTTSQIDADEVVYTTPTWLSVYLPLGISLAGALLVWRVIARYRRLERTAFEAERDVANDDIDRATTKLEKLAEGRQPIIVATARLQLAAIANRKGDFARAVTEADRGIAAAGVNATTRALASDLYTPGLIAERAFAVAALGRFVEAETELAAMSQAFPTYALMARASFRIRLMTAIRSGQNAVAARIARSRAPDLALDLRTDLLADVVLAESGEPMGAQERERIAAELHDLPEIAQWIERVQKAEKVHVSAPLVVRVGDDDAASSYVDDDDDEDDDAVEEMSPARARRALQQQAKRR